jgi:hypothetical protein
MLCDYCEPSRCNSWPVRTAKDDDDDDDDVDDDDKSLS